MLTFTPLVVFVFFISINSYGGSLLLFFTDLFGFISNPHPMGDIKSLFPSFNIRTLYLYIFWLSFQFILAVGLPGPYAYGQATPAGHVLKYKVNGLRVWFLTHFLFIFCGWYLKLFPLSIIYDEWGPLLWSALLYGYCLAVFAYIKGCFFPSHPDDVKYSGSIWYDMFMGIELNPRFGDWFDFKLFHNGRPGIVAWTLINLSMAAKQYQIHGFVTNSMIGVNILHAIYVVDFFWNENWYLRTIDIAHDHFGYYLAWGDTVWLPYMYTLQAFYLVRNPIELSNLYFILVMSMGLFGYFIFRSVNDQKDKFRQSKGKCTIWGKPATYITCTFATSDGKHNESFLLTSGWWGLSRHFNYIGDLLISLAFCMCCGMKHLLPYFYIVYMTILLVHRVGRDDLRCRQKYGKYWEEYCRTVPAKIVPYVY